VTKDDPTAALSKTLADARRMTPIRRAALYSALSDQAKGIFATAADAAIVEAIDAGASYQQLAAELGVSTSSINKRASRHRARLRAAAPEEEPCPEPSSSPEPPAST